MLSFKSESIDSLKAVFQEISQISFVDDGLTYLSDTVNVIEIREDQQHGGLRVTLTAMLGAAKIQYSTRGQMGQIFVIDNSNKISLCSSMARLLRIEYPDGHSVMLEI